MSISLCKQVAELFNHINEGIGSYTYSQWVEPLIEQYQTSKLLMTSIVFLFLAIFFVSLAILRKWKNKEFLPEVKEFVGVGSAKPRFRKRDKVLFYGRKMLRQVKSIGGQVHPTGQGKKRRAVMRFARRLLQLKKETVPQQLKVIFSCFQHIFGNFICQVFFPFPSKIIELQKNRQSSSIQCSDFF